CEVIRDDHGRDAELELKGRLAAHDQAMQPKARLTWRRHLNGTKAPATREAIKRAPAPLRDVLDIAVPSPDPSPEPEPSKVLLRAVRFSTEAPKPNDAPAVLSQVAPYDSAKEYVGVIPSAMAYSLPIFGKVSFGSGTVASTKHFRLRLSATECTPSLTEVR